MSMQPAKGGKNVAVIDLVGSLMKQQPSFGGTSTVQVRRDVRSATNDPNVNAILLRIDSPGGTVSGTADLAADVKAARRKKPVWAFAEDTCASAAYWIASQADQLFANAGTALVGSIGTLLTVYDTSAAADAAGVKALVFATGPLKGAGTPDAPVTDEQIGYFQALVNQTQTFFDSAVMKGRGLSASQLTGAKTGGVFGATEALDKRLIDGIQSFDATLEALAAAK
jgi:signal peptide peptidase SppA